MECSRLQDREFSTIGQSSPGFMTEGSWLQDEGLVALGQKALGTEYSSLRDKRLVAPGRMACDTGTEGS
ncbi:hypothetical protein Nepgr_031069 [Nepenthes gracilis]|uniref:Uncharacterized protein n=1 Tax=Nepenthes gracilis TaxID=150966 RepID=A0AAD3THS1_NEPGR|nr:hypothetical protein Nepgr_031069 [Nepenthes gracilis]